MNAMTYRSHTNHGPAWFTVQMKCHEGWLNLPLLSCTARTFALRDEAEAWLDEARRRMPRTHLRVAECNVFGERV